jgi:hypothetical protein
MDVQQLKREINTDMYGHRDRTDKDGKGRKRDYCADDRRL